jgi:maleylacetate reductase
MQESDKFVLEQRAHKVVFGDRVQDVLARELEAIGFRRYMLVTTPGLDAIYERLIGHLDDATFVEQWLAQRFTEVVPHVPETVVEKAILVARECRADGIVAFGGGSALDTAKAIANRIEVPILAIPTNFSGSEVTPNFGLSSDGFKHTIINAAVQPRTVIYDPSLLATLPNNVAVTSGINAVAHAVEALYAPHANPLTIGLAETGVRRMVDALRTRNFAIGEEWESGAFIGSWLCGEVMAQVGMGLHHRICHVLGGTFGLSHADVHTVVLPYSIAFNYEAAPVLRRLNDLFPGDSVAGGLAKFSVDLGAPTSLQEVGLKEEQIAQTAELALRTPVANPRNVTASDIEKIVRSAFEDTLHKR